MGKPSPSFRERPRSGRPRLVRQVNQRSIFEMIQNRGSVSRAELARLTGASMPTASKTVARLLKLGLIEEHGIVRPDGKGRPSVMYRLAGKKSRVIGISFEPHRCRVACAGIDGLYNTSEIRAFPTPATYQELLDKTISIVQSAAPQAAKTLQIGISVPGNVDNATQQCLFAPNLHILDGRKPGLDIQNALGIQTRIVHETIATCLAERIYGEARGVRNFVMIGTYEGFGMSAVVNGDLLVGSHGLAGELGHITVQADGELCGCGNRGCLETVSTDPAFTRLVNRTAGKSLNIQDIRDAVHQNKLDVTAQLLTTLDFLATGVAAAINIFDPEIVALCSRMFEMTPDAFAYLNSRIIAKTLQPMAQRCQIIRVEGDTLRGGVAAAIYHIVESLGPQMNWAEHRPGVTSVARGARLRNPD